MLLTHFLSVAGLAKSQINDKRDFGRRNIELLSCNAESRDKEADSASGPHGLHLDLHRLALLLCTS